VKVSYARNKGRGAWRAQGRYLRRTGAQREGERGLGFDANRDDVDLPDRLDAWQKARDQRLWKIVVSPEAGDRVDLRDHARRLVAQMEADLGTRLEWAAIDHHDTDHPHVHIVVRGVDQEGKPLFISREYVRSGIRARSQELLTRALGHRHELDRKLERERAVDAPRITEIDRSLLDRAGADGVISFEVGTPASDAPQERRIQDLRRLHYLEGLGLAERLGRKRWRLSPNLAPALRQIQVAGDIQKSVARSYALVTDRHAPLVFTRMESGVEVTGRVAGAGLDEARDEPFLILEGTDGSRHLVAQTSEILRAREQGRLRPGTVVTLRARVPSGGQGPPRTEIREHGRLRDLKRAETAATALDLDALRSIRETGALPPAIAGGRGFFRQWRSAVLARGRVLEREGLIRRAGDEASGRTYDISEGAERMVEARMTDRGRVPTNLRELERSHGKEIELAQARAGLAYRGELVAYATSDDGTAYAVLDTGRRLTAVPTDRRDLEVGHAVRARAQAGSDDETSERRRLTWALDDIAHERDRGRGR
jgi:type IV secretory pathway VirD2 relaxase